MTDFSFTSATELASLVESKQVSPVELTQQFLDRIDEKDETYNAFITVTHDYALEQAREAEKKINDGQYKGPLHGIPIGVKDTFQVKGITTTSGSKLYENYIPDATSTAAQQLFDAGGIMLGKLNLHSLGPGSTGINPTFGSARNPWNTDYITGGSSSGSAAALAAGLAPIVTGADMWGSLRVPAAMTGVYGFKTTNGLVSGFGNIPTSTSLHATGPMARTVPDLGLMLNYMVGYDPKYPSSLNVVHPDYTTDLDKGIKGLRIGIPSYYKEGLDPEIEKLFNESVEKLKGLGAEIQEIDIPELNLSKFAGLVTALSEAGANYYDSMQKDPQVHAEDIRALLASGSLISGTQYIKAQQARRELSEAFTRAFENLDIMVAPTIPIRTPKFEEDWVKLNLEVVEKILPFTVPANVTGKPALSVPMGLDSDGLPTGMQFIGPGLSEKRLLQAAKAWETTEPISYGNEN